MRGRRARRLLRLQTVAEHEKVERLDDGRRNFLTFDRMR